MKKNFLLSTVALGMMLHASLPAIVPHKNKSVAQSPKARQTRPIPLGVSGGSTVDKAKDYCCSGTLGSLVKDASGTFYILSNTHVFAGDSAPGANHKVSAKGDPINQPGYIDINCQNNANDYVAKLTAWAKIVPNGTSFVDAAIAEIIPGKVDASGTILGIGTISSTPVAAFVGQKVKKNGRTSGFTTGKIAGLHASITVEYSTECGGSEYASNFENQILISPGSFLAGGDSGSLLVEDVATNPRPIGLLFAGSSSIAIANPIQDVLNALNVEMVGVAKEEEPLVEHELIRTVLSVKTKYAQELMQIPGVVGHAVGFSSTDDQVPVVLVLVRESTEELMALMPQELDGTPVEVMQVGHIVAL